MDVPRTGVLCVDDRPEIALAVQRKVRQSGELQWKGWLARADRLGDEVRNLRPQVVLVDLDMPGKSPLLAIEEVARSCPLTRVIVYSAQVSADLIKQTLDAGAWGYVTKDESGDELIATIKAVAAGECTLSPRARSELPP